MLGDVETQLKKDIDACECFSLQFDNWRDGCGTIVYFYQDVFWRHVHKRRTIAML